MENLLVMKRKDPANKENFEHLNYIKWQLREKFPVIQLHGNMKLTKTQANYVEATLLRDTELEKDVKSWIQRRSSFEEIMWRYHNYDIKIPSMEWPAHYPMKFLSGKGSVCSNDNIFMFFPEVLGLSTGEESDYFGFEFIDIWCNVFEEVVFPCVQKVFTKRQIISLAHGLRSSLPKTIYLASVFHEVGHRVGPWRVSPKTDPRLNINQYNLDILGELATDSLLVKNLKEFPEIAQFVLYQRLFWFTRRGYRNNPLSSDINTDNDAWIGAYLWEKALEKKLIFPLENKFSLNEKLLVTFFEEILQEIDELGAQVLSSKSSVQDKLVDQWRDSSVESTDLGQALLPKSLRRAYSKCQSVVYVPHFTPLLSE